MKTIINIAIALLFSISMKAQYTVTSIPYNPPAAFNTGTPVLDSIDDLWSSAITIPFSFYFYGNQYTQLVIGANEIISFNSSYAGSYCPWILGSGVPTNTYPVNSIMGPYQDIDPTYQGSIYWQVIGISPNRMLVVSYDSVPYFGGYGSVDTLCCPNPPIYATSQIVLYESTSIIDIYIQNKDTCTGWNGGLAIEGIQDATGANAAVVPGRNNTVWTASNDAWRFTPSGLIVNIVNIVNANCGSNNGSISTFTSWGVQPYTYLWNSVPPQTGQDLTNVPSGYYCVTVTDFNGDTSSTCGTVSTISYATPDICMVTVDTSTNHNLVIWEKPVTTGIDKYYIFRETSVGGIYNLIGTQNYSDFSTFVDTSSNSLQQPYRYELAIHDNCGLTSQQSAYHQTVHLTISAGMGGAWNLIWNNYEGFAFSTYNIYRGTSTGNMTLLNSVANTVNSYTDIAPPPGTLYYLIEVVKPTSCNPSKSIKNYSSVISNIANTNGVGITEIIPDDILQLFPNPGKGIFTLYFTDYTARSGTIEVENSLGQIVYKDFISANFRSIDLSAFSKGVYFLKLIIEKKSYFRKIIIE